MKCIQLLRDVLPKAQVSVEIEKPGREGLPELAAEADVVFFSRTWAEVGFVSRPRSQTDSDCHRDEGMCLPKRVSKARSCQEREWTRHVAFGDSDLVLDRWRCVLGAQTELQPCLSLRTSVFGVMSQNHIGE